jgi:WD40 repeat protein
VRTLLRLNREMLTAYGRAWRAPVFPSLRCKQSTRIPFRNVIVARRLRYNAPRAASTLLLLIAMLLLFTRGSDAAEPPTTAFLRLETGMHTRQINEASVDSKGRWLLTVSTDKTARVWSVNGGKLEQILRPPIVDQFNSPEGVLYAGALSPDATVAAVAGDTGNTWDTFSIYIFDRASGRLLKRIRGLPSAVIRLSYSPDGRWLAACANDGLHMYDASGDEVGRDIYNNYCYGIGFDHSDRLVTSSFDSQIRLYAVETGHLRKLMQRTAPGGKPSEVQFSPNGAFIAVGSRDTAVDVLHSASLSLAYAPDTGGGIKGHLSRIAWSADGQSLYAGGTAQDERGRSVIRRWSQGGRTSFRDVNVSNSGIAAIAALNDGRIVFAGLDPMWGVLSPQDEVTLHQAQVADLRDTFDDFSVSADGRRVGFSYDSRGLSPAVFDVGSRTFQSDRSGLLAARSGLMTATGLAVAATHAPGLDLEIEKQRAILNGQPIELPNPVESAQSFAVAPDSSGFAIGTELNLYYLDRTGHLLWQVHPGTPVCSLYITSDGKLIVAAFFDGTIRWYRRSDHGELLAFFPHPDRKRWILWTPSGYYDASPGGEDLIGWHVNRGADEAADFFPASRFRASRYRPDVIAQILTTQDEAQALAISDTQAGRADRTAKVNQLLPPIIEILSPKPGTRVSTSPVVVRFRVRAPADAPPTMLRVRVNGQNMALPDLDAVLSQPGEEKQIAVAISGDSNIALFAQNRNNWSPEAKVQLSWASAAPKPTPIATLYVLAVGITKYEDANLQTLHYAAKDADDFVRVIQGQKHSGIYRDVVINHIPQERADAKHIREGLSWLSRQVGADDTGILFFSGHGEVERDIYYFLPVDANPDDLEPTAITKDEISSVLSRLAGKAVLLMDTCHAGRMAEIGRKGVPAPDITGVINELASSPNGVVVLASSTGREESEEDPKAQNGAFTEALLEGLSGHAPRDAKGAVTVEKLGEYLSDRVKQITNGRQHPVPDLGSIPDFPIAIAP